MRKSAIFPAWARILRGYRPFLSIEITKRCPLRCPGCYAYDPNHLNSDLTMLDLDDWTGPELEARVLALISRFRPLHVSFIGGEPLIRARELTSLIQELGRRKIEAQIVTSAVMPIPESWARFENVHLVVSVDGLQPEHDARRAPATYKRILRNISGHGVVIHCTITPGQLIRAGDLAEFAGFWSSQPNVTKIWFSLFTPQINAWGPERLNYEERKEAIARIAALTARFCKVYATKPVIDGYKRPPDSPAECIFAQTTTCISADLNTQVTPCQIGGRPDCSQCGCIAAAGLAAVGRFRVAGIKVSRIFDASRRFGCLLGTMASGRRWTRS